MYLGPIYRPSNTSPLWYKWDLCLKTNEGAMLKISAHFQWWQLFDFHQFVSLLIFSVHQKRAHCTSSSFGVSWCAAWFCSKVCISKLHISTIDINWKSLFLFFQFNLLIILFFKFFQQPKKEMFGKYKLQTGSTVSHDKEISFKITRDKTNKIKLMHSLKRVLTYLRTEKEKSLSKLNNNIITVLKK